MIRYKTLLLSFNEIDARYDIRRTYHLMYKSEYLESWYSEKTTEWFIACVLER